MVYPSLVRVSKTPIKITIYADEVNEDGAPIILFEKDLLCNYQNGGKQHKDKEHNTIIISGNALFNGDVFSEIDDITGGKAFIFGKTRLIYKGYKERNPDGTVNYTRLELI